MHNDIITTIVTITIHWACLSTQRIDSVSRNCEKCRLSGRYSRIEKDYVFNYNPKRNS